MWVPRDSEQTDWVSHELCEFAANKLGQHPKRARTGYVDLNVAREPHDINSTGNGVVVAEVEAVTEWILVNDGSSRIEPWEK